MTMAVVLCVTPHSWARCHSKTCMIWLYGKLRILWCHTENVCQGHMQDILSKNSLLWRTVWDHIFFTFFMIFFSLSRCSDFLEMDPLYNFLKKCFNFFNFIFNILYISFCNFVQFLEFALLLHYTVTIGSYNHVLTNYNLLCVITI